jgi:hypothetical protein
MHDKAEILLKVALNTIALTKPFIFWMDNILGHCGMHVLLGFYYTSIY